MSGEYNLGTASGRIDIDGRGAAAGFKVAETAAGAFMGVVQQKMDSVTQLGRRTAAVGGAATAGFGLAIRTAANFEKQMSGVQAVAGGTEEEFEALRQKALQLGADTTFSASEAALAIEELAKAGIPIEDILNGAAEGAVALAAAGGIGLAEAATIASNAMNQFGLGADQVGNVADILAGVANTSAADVSSIGQSLSQAGAVANLAGLSFKDTAIAIGEMADAGINGSDAGTSLKTMLNNLIPVTDKQRSEFADLGLLTQNLADANKTLAKEGLKPAATFEEARDKLSKYNAELGNGKVGSAKNAKAVDEMLMKYGGLNNQFFDAKGNVKDLRGLQDTLGKSLEGMTKQQKLSSLEMLFGADAMRASAILSLAGAKGYDEFASAVDKTSAAEVAATRLDNLDGAMEGFSGAMETAQITIGAIFLPMITKIIQGATALVNVFNGLPAGVQKGIAVFVGIASIGAIVVGLFLAMLPVIIGMIANFLLMRSLGFVITFFKTLVVAARAGTLSLITTRTAALATGNSFLTLGARTLFASKIMLGFAKIMARVWVAITGPIGLAVAAVAALVAIGYLLYQRWEPFRNLVNAIGAAIKGALIAAWQALMPVVDQVVAALVRFGSFVKSTLLPVLTQVGAALLGKLLSGWGQIGDAVEGQLLPALQSLGNTFTGTILPALRDLWSAAQPLIMGFLRFAAVVGGALLTALMAIGRVFISNVLPVLIRVAGFIGGVLIQAIVDFVKAAIQVVTGVVQIFTGLINFFKGLFTGNWSQMWNGLLTILKGIWNLIVGVVKIALMVGIGKVIGVALRMFAGLFRAGWGLITGIFRTVGRVLMTIIRAGMNFIRGVIARSVNFWRAAFARGWALIMGVVRAGVNFIRSIISAVLKAVTGVVRGNIRTVQSTFQKGWNAAKEITSKAFNRIKESVSTGVKNVLTKVKEIPGKVKGALGNLGSTLYQSGKDLIQGLINGIGEKIGAAVEKVRAGVSRIRGLLPGSPIKWGPLRSWNRGGAGKRLMNTLTEGIQKERGSVIAAAHKTVDELSRVMSDPNLAVEPRMISAMTPTAAASPVAVAASVATPPRRKAGAPEHQNKRLRLVEGQLSIDSSGRTFIRGVAEEVVDETRAHDARTGRRSMADAKSDY